MCSVRIRRFGEKSMNRKKFGIVLLCILAAACTGWFVYDMTRPEEYLFLMGEVHSYEDFPMYQAFEQQIQKAGGKAVILESEDKKNNSIEQVRLLQEYVNRHTACILIDAASSDGASEVLKEYLSQGIPVITCRNDTSDGSRTVFAGTADPAEIGSAMMQEAIRLGNDTDRFAIVSGSPTAVSVTTILQHIRQEYERGETHMQMEDIIYGYEDHEIAVEKITELLENDPELDILLCTTEYMTQAAVETAEKMGMTDQILIVGVGQYDSFADADTEDLSLVLFGCDLSSYGQKLGELAISLAAGGTTELPEKKIYLTPEISVSGTIKFGVRYH